MSNPNVTGFDDTAFTKKSNNNWSNDLRFTPKYTFSTKNNPMSGVTFSQWWYILFRHIYHVELKYIPRIAFISVLSVVNSVLSLVESMLYEKAILCTNLPEDPVFIVGHPRTGTTLLQNFLASDQASFYFCSTFCAGFPSCFLWFEAVGKRLFASILEKTRPMDSMPLHFDLPQEDELATNLLSHGKSYYMPLWFMAQEPQFRRYFDFCSEQGATDEDETSWITAFLYFLRKLTLRARLQGQLNECKALKDPDSQHIAETQNPRLLLKSPVHTARIPLLRRLFPKAKFVYIHRDPYEVLQSAAHMADTTYWYCYLNTPTNEQVAEFIYWQFEYMWLKYDAAARGGEPKASPAGPSTPGGALPRAQQVAADILEVSYDELTSDPLGTLRSVYAHIGIRWTAETEAHYASQASSLSSYKKNSHTTLPPIARDTIKRRWRSYFDEFGYVVQDSSS